MKKYYQKTLIVLIAIISFIFLYKNLYLSHYLKIEMSANKGTFVQVFYDIGYGFSEVNSKLVYPKTNDEFSVYSLKLPNKKIYSLRIDPLNTVSNFKIKSLKIDNKITNKTYFPSDLQKNILSTNQIINMDVKDKFLSGFSSGNDPYIVFNNFIGNDFRVPLWIKIIFLTLLFIFLYIILLVRKTKRIKSIKSKFVNYIDFINHTKFISSLELKYRIDIYIYISVVLIIILGGLHTFFISPLSFIRAFSLTITSIFLSFTAWALLSFLPKTNLLNLLNKPFHSLFLGQLILFIYIYVRSTFNEYVYYIPLTFIEFIIILILLIILIIKKFSKALLLTIFHEQKKMLILSFGLFFLVMIGISENELPRIFMLSTDPDQHVFFGKQIERFGTIPFQQFFWGKESFNYPAGTGVLSYIWSSLTFFDIRNTLHIQPLLQAVISIFLITEIIIYKKFNAKIFLLISIGLLFVFTYILRYTLEPNHFHFEGTGRLISISINAFVISILMFSFMHRNHKNSVSSAIIYILFIATIMFYSATLNPINIFYTSTLLGISFLIYFIQNMRFYLLTPIVLIFFILLLLDPYYLNVLIYKSHNNIVHTLHHKPFNLTLNELMYLTWMELKNRIINPSDFFKMIWVKGQFTSLYILISLSLISFIGIYKKRENSDKIFFSIILSIFVVFILWVPLSSFLFILSDSATDYRLMSPYFSFNVMQYLYIFILLILASIIFKFSEYIINTKQIIIIGILVLVLLLSLDNIIGNTQHIKRVEYGMNSLVKDDEIVIKEIERKYKLFISNKSRTDYIPKILITNIMPIMGDEKWLFPVNASRILPFYETFPLAFYYFKGENYYTYENYNKYICKNFDINWLKTKNIQYLFIPSGDNGCIYNKENILENNTILINRGDSYFIKLYN